MADPVALSSITAGLATVFRPNVVRTFNGRSTLLRLLRKVPGNGQTINWDLESTAANAESFTDGTDVSTYAGDDTNKATLGWPGTRANFRITDQALDLARMTGNPADLANLFGTKFLGSVIKLASTFNGLLYTGTGGSGQPVGLATFIDDSNTVAGIDRSSTTYFDSYVIDPGSLTAPTLVQLRTDLGAIYDNSGMSPDIAVCPTAVWNKLASLFTDMRRYTQDVMTNGGPVRLDASVDALVIDGCTVLKDKDATANRIYYLNTEAVEIQYIPQDIAGNTPLADVAMAADADDGFGAIPLGMKVYKLAKSGPSQKFSAQIHAALVVTNPKACGVRKNVSTT